MSKTLEQQACDARAVVKHHMAMQVRTAREDYRTAVFDPTRFNATQRLELRKEFANAKAALKEMKG